MCISQNWELKTGLKIQMHHKIKKNQMYKKDRISPVFFKHRLGVYMNIKIGFCRPIFL